MKFEHPLIEGRLVKRYKRFMADVVPKTNDEAITIHCPNTGSMKNCLFPGERVWYWDSGNPKRKYRHTWELAENTRGELIGINTHRANALVIEALEQGLVPELVFQTLKTEVPYGEQRSRIDILLDDNDLKTWVEVKSVTLASDEDEGLGYFPDAVSTRATKHLDELMLMRDKGDRAALIFCVQHTGIKRVQAAAHIDPVYAERLLEAKQNGVEIFALGCSITQDGITPFKLLPVELT